MTTSRSIRLRAAIVVCATAAALGATPAAAGTYAVRACGSDGANRAFRPAASSGLTAYSQCPATDYQGTTTGLVARAGRNAGGGGLPAGAYAWQIFEAPPGAVLESMTFLQSSGRSSGCWSFGVFGWDGDAFHPGEHLWGYPANCPTTGAGFVWYIGPYQLDLKGHQKVRVGVRCDASSCSTSASDTWANLKDVTVVVRDGSTPAVSPRGGELFGAGWHRGTEWAWADAADNVGIRGIYGQFDDGGRMASQDYTAPGTVQWAACDFARTRPCSDIPNAGLAIDTGAVPDGRHTFRFVAEDAAGNAGSVERVLSIDNHPPASPRSVTVAGGEGWRRAGPFDVAWENPPGQTAPIVRAHWRLCHAGSCQDGSRDGEGISRLERLGVPGAGDSTLALWLADEAGNVDMAHAAEAVHLRLDDVAPRTPGFDLLDPSDPRRVSLAVSDAHSGVASASVELRERGAREWRALPVALEGGYARARVPDTELADGTYELRALIRDAAGNETVADRDVLGRPMTVVLPLRLPTRITRRAAASTLRDPLRIPFGRSATVTGALETWQGRPVSRAVVDVLERPRTEREWRRTGGLGTDSAGRFSWRLGAGPSRYARLAYGGDDLLLPSSLDTRILVPAAGTLRVSRRRARNGQRILFSGRLRGLPLPSGGRTVDLQAHYRGTWRTFATPRTDRRGRWRQSYRFGATRGRVVYRFRALIKRDAAYPYETGASPVARVVVTG